MNLTIRAFLSLILSCSILISCYAWAGDRGKDCKKKKNCTCECTHMDARAKGDGPCSIAEKKGDWCEISYSLSTGSFGELSSGPSFDTSTQNLGGLPDHRSDSYAEIVRSLRRDFIFNPKGAIEAGERAVAKDDATGKRLISLLIRSSYVSSPEISVSEVSDLDKILHRLFYDGFPLDQKAGSNIVSVFFSRKKDVVKSFSSGQLSSSYLDSCLVQPGYLYIKRAELELHLIWRLFIPD